MSLDPVDENISSGNGLVLLANKPLPEPMLMQFCTACGITGPQWVNQWFTKIIFSYTVGCCETAVWYITILHTALQWASYQIRKIAGCACAGNAGNVFPRRRFQRKLLVSDPGMHHGTCVTHVPWCMSGSLTCGDGENVPGIPSACAPAILRIWQEAHDRSK